MQSGSGGRYYFSPLRPIDSEMEDDSFIETDGRVMTATTMGSACLTVVLLSAHFIKKIDIFPHLDQQRVSRRLTFPPHGQEKKLLK